MQRHKQALEFLQSPYQGSKRYNSPVLAARRPYLAPSVFAEELQTKWVSPQFQSDNDNGSPVKKSKRRTRRQKAPSCSGQTKSKENSTAFPELNFTSRTKTVSQKTKSTRTNRLKSQCSRRPGRKDQSYFLFELGSPKTPTVPGEILVKETPENEIGVRNWKKRLRQQKFDCTK